MNNPGGCIDGAEEPVECLVEANAKNYMTCKLDVICKYLVNNFEHQAQPPKESDECMSIIRLSLRKSQMSELSVIRINWLRWIIV